MSVTMILRVYRVLELLLRYFVVIYSDLILCQSCVVKSREKINWKVYFKSATYDSKMLDMLCGCKSFFKIYKRSINCTSIHFLKAKGKVCDTGEEVKKEKKEIEGKVIWTLRNSYLGVFFTHS